MLHVVAVAVPPDEPRELLVFPLQPLRRDRRLLQERLPLQLQEGHVQIRVEDLGEGRDGRGPNNRNARAAEGSETGERDRGPADRRTDGRTEGRGSKRRVGTDVVISARSDHRKNRLRRAKKERWGYTTLHPDNDSIVRENPAFVVI